MRRYKVNLKAGELVALSARGDYVRVIMSDGELKIEPNNSQSLQGMTKGMAYTAPVTFNELKLTSDIDQQVELMAGVGKIEDNRATINGTIDVAGVVEVVNSDKTRTEQNIAFMKGWGLNPGESSYSYISIANPPGSNVNLIVNQMIITDTQNALSNGMRFKGVFDYLALEGEDGFTHVESFYGDSKWIGGPQSKGLLRVGKTTKDAHINDFVIASPHIVADDFAVIRFVEPFIIEPGRAFAINNAAVGEVSKVTFEWFEEPVS